MFATALNLLPGGQPDGGHIVFSLSPRAHRMVSRLTILALIPMAYYFWVGWLLWAILLRISGMRHPMVEQWPGVTAGAALASGCRSADDGAHTDASAVCQFFGNGHTDVARALVGVWGGHSCPPLLTLNLILIDCVETETLADTSKAADRSIRSLQALVFHDSGGHFDRRLSSRDLLGHDQASAFHSNPGQMEVEKCGRSNAGHCADGNRQGRPQTVSESAGK
jgi:hypothetical protein